MAIGISRKVRHVVLLCFVLVSALLPLAPDAIAQGETTSAILGQVTDATGAAIPRSTVTVTNRETGLKRMATTDDSGRFNFPQLKPGAYSVRVEAEGFTKASGLSHCTVQHAPHDRVSIAPRVLIPSAPLR